ncbi:MAG: flavodoxin family protein [Clostridiales bacterium]|jgi:multimeric flavodoxin WrbA|nr:flavodoxin family protein [Clostridiales bacterium]
MSKLLVINGSPRKNGNTARMLKTITDYCDKAGVETEFFQAGGNMVHGCIACGKCAEHKGECTFGDDFINELYQKVKAADAIVIGSPTYYGDVTTEVKALMDRIGFISGRDGRPLSRKIGAAVVSVRRCGGMHTLDTINHFYGINDMIVPGSTYWNMTLSRDIGDFEKDDEGVATITRLAENLVYLLEKLKG